MKKYGGARTNLRIIAIRDQDKLSRSDLARLTGYSKGYVDNWLLPAGSKYWRRAPDNAVRLLEFETRLRDELIDAAALAVAQDRKGIYKNAAAVADAILKQRKV